MIISIPINLYSEEMKNYMLRENKDNTYMELEIQGKEEKVLVSRDIGYTDMDINIDKEYARKITEKSSF